MLKIIIWFSYEKKILTWEKRNSLLSYQFVLTSVFFYILLEFWVGFDTFQRPTVFSIIKTEYVLKELNRFENAYV